MKKTLTLLTAIFLVSCQKEAKAPVSAAKPQASKTVAAEPLPEEEIRAATERPDFITGDFDGDAQQDSVFIVTDTATEKAALKIKYANGKTDVLGQGNNLFNIDDYSWVGVFEKAPKGERYADNTDEDGEFRDMDAVPEEEWVTLQTDGIYIHQAESCGGGMIYLDNGEYKWIQQE